LIEWLKMLVECAENMKSVVAPLLGTIEARETFGRGAGGDVKRRIDLAAEDALIQTLQEHDVSCTLISEEAGVKQIGDHTSECYVVADPVDGTANAARGLPFADISLAVSDKPMLSGIEFAIVADVMRNATYTASKGEGAYRNGTKLKPSETAKLEEAFVGVDFCTSKLQQIVDQLTEVLEKTRHVRHFGANALEICYVADGKTDVFIDIRGKLRITDIAAAYLILLEAGGVFTTPEGTTLNVPLEPKQRVSFVAAANKSMHNTIMNMIRKT
jgi:myo-inositol-1(or 4)-monophosphatase